MHTTVSVCVESKRKAAISVINTSQQLPIITQTVCSHVSSAWQKKHRINSIPIWTNDGPILMDVGGVWGSYWFQGCSFLICEGSLAAEGYCF